MSVAETASAGLGLLPVVHPLCDVADATGIPLRFLADGCRARRFEHTRIGRTAYMTAAQVGAMLEQLRVACTEPSMLADPDLERDRRRAFRAIARSAQRSR